MTAGRPSKYKEEFIKEVDNYIDSLPNNKLPTKQGFALRIGVDDDTLDNWAKDNKEFFGALKKLMQKQAEQLINDGIYNREANSTIVKLLLQNNHGMKERTDQTTNDKDLPTPLLNAIRKDDVCNNNGGI